MTSIKQEARLANGRSHQCEKCPFGNGRCTLELHRVCGNNFVEGFIKGVRFIKKKMKEDKIKISSRE